MVMAETRNEGFDVMAAVRPRIKLSRLYTITNAAELAPIAELAREYIEANCFNAKTRNAYRLTLEYFVKYCGERYGLRPESVAYSELDRKIVESFKDYRLEIEAPASVQLRIRLLRSFGNWVERRYGVPSPVENVREPEIEDEQFKGLDEKQVAALIQVCRAESDPFRRFVPLFLLGTGLRADELRQLALTQIAPDLDWITRVRGKSIRPRDVALKPDTRRETMRFLWFREQYSTGSNAPLVPSRRDSRLLGEKTIWNWVHAPCMATGIIPPSLAHPHTLRHTFAYQTLRDLELQNVKPLRAATILMGAMGHRSFKTTLRYLGNDAAEIWELFQRM